MLVHLHIVYGCFHIGQQIQEAATEIIKPKIVTI